MRSRQVEFESRMVVGFTRRLPSRPVLASQGASWGGLSPTTSVGSSAILDAARLTAAPIAAVVA
jgi:hypothetical protein